MNRLKFEVNGRVQGISFRRTVKKIADELDIDGYVKNNENGTVTILAQAPKEKLNIFSEKIKESPGYSKVDSLIIIENPESEIIDDSFVIKKNGNFVTDKPKSWFHLGKYYLSSNNNKNQIPKHIAIIPDGNRRWARDKGREETFGHEKSAEYDNLKSLFDEARSQGIEYMTIWGFSTENWKRSQTEITIVFNLVTNFLENFEKDLHEFKIHFTHIGRKDRLPEKLSSLLSRLENETSSYDNFHMQLGLDYGGRDELIRAINKAISEGKKISNEEEFKKYLDTKSIPDVDLIIRTSGEKRLSGFLPYQSVYSELYFTDKHFPDFDRLELRKAIQDFSNRKRRFGGN
ncbi:di-trans,poly-cis-decaprenylcistransferase [Candidatus Pacearchaeota archaeon CG10_big_fil_rev_8_21_14_0_10_32_14]|nr:MAG: di-trans,poly-cis-decaprenylcistransferase [Candidatus Pacearchaeota archaeon CG10_big_fil_rev_8_21_14_0_10_32_14]